VTVREATGAEHAAVMDLLRSYLDELWQRPFPPGQLDPGMLAGKVVFVAEEDGQIVGTAFGDVAVPDRPAHLNLVYVEPGRRGGGIGRAVVPPQNGWIGVYDELCGREPELLRRLARELSDRFGVAVAIGVESGAVVRYVLFDRGRMVDEYLSVPEFHGPLPPGDVIALGANPTLLARLTGADPGRVRAVARTAASPADLPPAEELVVQIGELLGLSCAELGYEETLALPDVRRIER
jgi:GNAT superfamily N-acetyltransferase